MKRVGAITVSILAGAVLAISVAWAADAPATTSTEPPKNLKKVGDHWTPWDPPAAGPDAYIIQKGDTLWDLAGKWLGNPNLWPQVWDQNRYILDSHWIYPGDPLGVPGKPTVVPPEGPPPTEETKPTAGTTAAAPAKSGPAPVAPAPAPLYPLGDASDVYCSGVIEPAAEAAQLVIAGRGQEREFMAQGDVVYLSQGRAQGMKTGTEYAIRRIGPKVVHPATGAALGNYVSRLGKLRVIAVQENTSTAVIVESCSEVNVGDEAWPWEEIPIPRAASLPEFDRWNAEPSGGVEGWVVASRDPITVAGTGHILYSDLGGSNGARPGTVLAVYREQQGGLPRLMLGQAVVLETREGTSTLKVVRSVQEIEVGDRVEMIR